MTGANAATRGLFLFDGLKQRVEFDYRYRGLSLSEDGAGTTRSIRHRFEETYSVGINYVLRGPNLLFGGARIETKWDQLNSSVSNDSSDRSITTNGSRLLYDIYGTFLRYHPVSLRFFSNSKMSHVSREFAQSYDQVVYANGLSLHTRNLTIPFNVDFRQTETETDGLVSDYTRKNKSLMIDTRHVAAGFSQTFLNLQFDEYQTRYTNDLSDYELEASRFLLTNDLKWTAGKNLRRLSSRVSYKEQVGTTDSKGYDWSENLEWNFGRALIGTLYYNRVYTERELNELQRDQGRAALRHQFLECIDTQIGLELRDTTQDDGVETDRSGDMSLAYRKKLPRDSYLHTNFYHRYGTVDRDYSTYIQTVVDESHTADSIVPVTLDHFNVISETVVVRNADLNVRSIPYVRDVDYQIDQVGVTTLISVLPGSDLVDGDNLLIDYSHLDSAQEKYNYVNRRASITLSIRNAYRFYGRWEDTTRSYQSGESLFFTGNGDLTEIVLGFDRTWQTRTFGLEYKTRRAYYEDRQSLEVFYQWSQRIKKGILSSGLGNYYASIEPSSGNNDYWLNTFSINSKYQTPLFKRGALGVYAKYANTSSDVNDRDDISLGFDYRHGYGKFMLTLNGKADWRFIGDQDRREETVNLKVSRSL